MDASQFTQAIRGLKAVPAEQRDQFVALGKKLSPEDRKLILTHLEGIEADLQKNETRYSASAESHRLMIKQVEDNDMPAFDALFHPAA
jgi:hypothetical protein